MNRLINEVSLWRLDTAGTAHRQALQALWQRPGVCRKLQGDSALAVELSAIAQTPQAHRDALFDGLAVSLQGWGTPRDATLATPAPDAALRGVVDAALAGNLPAAPMPPWVVWKLFDAQQPLTDLRDCRLQQWWLHAGLQPDGGDEQARLLRLRHALLPRIDDWMGDKPSALPADNSYPPLAQRYMVTGSTRVAVTFKPDGSFKTARVVGRDLVVPGIRDAPPVAFELLLDEAAVARAASAARAGQIKPAPGDGADAGPTVIKLVWKLEP